MPRHDRARRRQQHAADATPPSLGAHDSMSSTPDFTEDARQRTWTKLFADIHSVCVLWRATRTDTLSGTRARDAQLPPTASRARALRLVFMEPALGRQAERSINLDRPIYSAIRAVTVRSTRSNWPITWRRELNIAAIACGKYGSSRNHA